MILIDETKIPEGERADLAVVNAELEAVATRRVDRIDLLEEPYRRSKIAWKIAQFSNAMAHRFISLAEGVALSWNSSNVLSAVLTAGASPLSTDGPNCTTTRITMTASTTAASTLVKDIRMNTLLYRSAG